MESQEQICVAAATPRPSPYPARPGGWPEWPRPRAENRPIQREGTKRQSLTSPTIPMPASRNTSASGMLQRGKEGKAVIVDDSDSDELDILDSLLKPPKKPPQEK